MGWGCGSTCWRRLRDWQAAGVWQRLEHELLDRLGDADQIDWSRAAVDSTSIAAKRGARRPGRIRRIAASRGRGPGLEAPSCGRCLWPSPRGAPHGRERERLGGLRAGPGGDPADPPPARGAGPATAPAGQAPRRLGLRQAALPPLPLDAPHRLPDRADRGRVERTPGSSPLDRRAHQRVVQPLPPAPPPASGLRAMGGCCPASSPCWGSWLVWVPTTGCASRPHSATPPPRRGCIARPGRSWSWVPRSSSSRPSSWRRLSRSTVRPERVASRRAPGALPSSRFREP